MKVDSKTFDFVLGMVSTVFEEVRDVVHRYYFDDKKDRANNGKKLENLLVSKYRVIIQYLLHMKKPSSII